MSSLRITEKPYMSYGMLEAIFYALFETRGITHFFLSFPTLGIHI